MYQFSLACLQDDTEEADKLKARKLIKFAAKEGHENATVVLSEMYYYGICGKKKKEKARKLLRKAADSGNMSTLLHLESIYERGKKFLCYFTALQIRSFFFSPTTDTKKAVISDSI